MTLSAGEAVIGNGGDGWMQMYAAFRVTVAWKQNLKSESVEVNRSEWISFLFFKCSLGYAFSSGNIKNVSFVYK